MANLYRPLLALSPLLFSLAMSGPAFAGEGTEASAAPFELLPAADQAVSADAMVSYLRDTSHLDRVQQMAFLGSTPVGDQAAITTLLRGALHDDDPLVGETALRALALRDNDQQRLVSEADTLPFLGESADLAKLEIAARDDDQATLLALMKSGDAVVQESAFEALAAKDTRAAIAALKAEFRNPTSLSRLQTLQLLARSSYTASSETLRALVQEATHDTDPLVRDFAQGLLGQ